MTTEDGELTTLFLEELDELMAGVDGHLATPDDAASVAELRRVAHTLKSGAGMIGLDHLQACCQALEAVLKDAVSGARPLDADGTALVRRGFEAIRDAGDAIRTGAGEPAGVLDPLRAELEAHRAG